MPIRSYRLPSATAAGGAAISETTEIRSLDNMAPQFSIKVLHSVLIVSSDFIHWICCAVGTRVPGRLSAETMVFPEDNWDR